MNPEEFNLKLSKILEIKDSKEQFEQYVDLMLELDNHFPFDTSIKLIANNYPIENHMSLGLPDVYHKNGEVNVVTGYNEQGVMNQAYFVCPDGVITRYSLLDVEYQAQPPDKNKKKALLNYRLGSTFIHGKNVVNCLVGNFGLNYDSEQIVDLDEQKFNTLIRNIHDDEVQE